MLHELDRVISCKHWFDRAGDVLGENVLTLDTAEALGRTRAEMCIRDRNIRYLHLKLVMMPTRKMSPTFLYV